MSGITNDPSIRYQQQFNQIEQTLGSAEDEVNRLTAQNQGTVDAYKNAKAAVQASLDQARTFGLTDTQGKPLQFNTLQEFHDLCAKGGIKDKDGNLVNNGNGFQYSQPPMAAQLDALRIAEKNYNDKMAPALDRLNQAQRQMDTMGVALQDSLVSLGMMKQLLDSGDIEGAVMLLQTTRAKSLEGQLGTEIKSMQARNAQIKLLNEKLNQKQETFSKMDPENKGEKDLRASRQKEISDLKTEIDGMNGESQINMIRVQGLVNKRNEAFDMLSNLLGKFQKTIDGIVGNMR
jgi:hypothetical protein